MDTWQLDLTPVEPHQPRILRTDRGANRVILLRLPAGELLRHHQVRERALVFLMSGRAQIRHTGERRTLSAPALIHLEPAERHEVQAFSDSTLVICLSPWPGGYHDRPAADAAERRDGRPA